MLNAYCESHEIIHEATLPYLPKSNGVTKKKNKTLKNMLNGMIISSEAPLNLLGEAMLFACHV